MVSERGNIAASYSDESKADFYSFVRQLDAMNATLTNQGNTIVLAIAELFYGMGKDVPASE